MNLNSIVDRRSIVLFRQKAVQNLPHSLLGELADPGADRHEPIQVPGIETFHDVAVIRVLQELKGGEFHGEEDTPADQQGQSNAMAVKGKAAGQLPVFHAVSPFLRESDST